jgi:phage tail protein X
MVILKPSSVSSMSPSLVESRKSFTGRVGLARSREGMERHSSLASTAAQLPRQHAAIRRALARRAFGDTVHALCRRRRTMACAITSLFLIAMFGIIAAGLAFLPGTKEKPSAQRQDTPVAPSGDRVIA